MKKYYVVFEGRKPGIYTSWQECEAQVKGYSGQKFRLFSDEATARNALKEYQAHCNSHNSRPTKGLCADGSCCGNPGEIEYRVIDVESGKVAANHKYQQGTNNIAEFLGLVEALKLRKSQNQPVYSDSATAIAWVQSRKCGTKRWQTLSDDVKTAITKAQTWLEKQPVEKLSNIKKWETDKWGEIPADFGRKTHNKSPKKKDNSLEIEI